MPTAQPNNSVRNGFDALEAVAFADGGLSTGDLSHRLGLSKSVVSRIMLTLVELGYVHRVGRGQWRTHAGLLALGTVGLRHSPLVRCRKPMEDLAASLRCVAAAGFVWKRQVIYLFSAGGGFGNSYPVEDSSIGRLLTSSRPAASKLVWRSRADKNRGEFSLAVPFTCDGFRYGLAVAGPADLYRGDETVKLLQACATRIEHPSPGSST